MWIFTVLKNAEAVAPRATRIANRANKIKFTPEKYEDFSYSRAKVNILTLELKTYLRDNHWSRSYVPFTRGFFIRLKLNDHINVLNKLLSKTEAQIKIAEDVIKNEQKRLQAVADAAKKKELPTTSIFTRGIKFFTGKAPLTNNNNVKAPTIIIGNTRS